MNSNQITALESPAFEIYNFLPVFSYFIRAVIAVDPTKVLKTSGNPSNFLSTSRKES